MRIKLHIERLVLDGLPASGADGPRLRAAVEAELARLLATGGLSRELATGGAVPQLPAPAISVDRGEQPGALGRAVARSVHAGIGGPRPATPSGRGSRP